MSGTTQGLAREIVAFDPHQEMDIDQYEEDIEGAYDAASDSLEMDEEFFREWEMLQNEWSAYLAENGE